jgi:hypothetical protein
MMTLPYRPNLGCCIAFTWTVLVFVTTIVCAYTEQDEMFLHFGPSPKTVFGGIRVDTWSKWGAVMTYATLSQIIESIVGNTIRPYIRNVIRDHKTPFDEKPRYSIGQLYVQIYTIYSWITSVFDVFLWVTLQIQYLVPAMLMDVVATLFFTHGYLTHATRAATPPLLPMYTSTW